MYVDTMPSAEFRKRYASLRTATRVTVNGHVIGTWQPQVTTDGQPIADLLASDPDPRVIPYDQRPLRAVPKHR